MHMTVFGYRSGSGRMS